MRTRTRACDQSGLSTLTFTTTTTGTMRTKFTAESEQGWQNKPVHPWLALLRLNPKGFDREFISPVYRVPVSTWLLEDGVYELGWKGFSRRIYFTVACGRRSTLAGRESARRELQYRRFRAEVFGSYAV